MYGSLFAKEEVTRESPLPVNKCHRINYVHINHLDSGVYGDPKKLALHFQLVGKRRGRGGGRGVPLSEEPGGGSRECRTQSISRS